MSAATVNARKSNAAHFRRGLFQFLKELRANNELRWSATVIGERHQTERRR